MIYQLIFDIFQILQADTSNTRLDFSKFTLDIVKRVPKETFFPKVVTFSKSFFLKVVTFSERNLFDLIFQQACIWERISLVSMR